MLQDRLEGMEQIKYALEIRALTIRYADSTVRNIFVPDLFTADGIMDFGSAGCGRFVGREALGAFYSQAKKELTFEAHLVTNHSLVQLEKDRATGYTTTLGLAGFAESPNKIRMDAVTYRDTYVRQEIGWLFNERLITSRTPTNTLPLVALEQEAWSVA